MSQPLTKICNRCKKVKRLNEFFENATKNDHRNGICKECQAEVDKKNRELKK